jgi:hypothetical protein
MTIFVLCCSTEKGIDIELTNLDDDEVYLFNYFLNSYYKYLTEINRY